MTSSPGSRILWVFDFDGTLSRIVPDRERASLAPLCGKMLRFLLRRPRSRVAVISSRVLDDLVARVPLPGLFVGGGSGLEWRFPDGRRVRPDRSAERRLSAVRDIVCPVLSGVAALPGVEVEDKQWSAAIHLRKAPPESLRETDARLARLAGLPGLKSFRGVDVIEMELAPGGGKSAGLRRLCRLAGWHPPADRIVYAGDDENDAAAMRWALSRGGTAFCVGGLARVAGAHPVEDPFALARAVRRLADSGRSERKHPRGMEAT